MALTTSLIDQFTKAIKSVNNKPDASTSLEGTVVSISGSLYEVKLDGSTSVEYTPATSTVASTVGDRVTVSINNHEAVITGNLTDKSVGVTTASNAGAAAGATAGSSAGSTAANTYLTSSAGQTIIINSASSAGSTAANTYLTGSDGQAVITNAASTAAGGYIDANLASIGTLVTNNITSSSANIGVLTAGVINSSEMYTNLLKAHEIITESITADSADISTIVAKYMTSETAEFKQMVAGVITADLAHINALDTQVVNAVNAKINNLDTDTIFSNTAKVGRLVATCIDTPSMTVGSRTVTIQDLVVQSGFFTELAAQDGNYTHSLAAVEIEADAIKSGTIEGGMITTGTLMADRLILTGEDGLYYQINAARVADMVDTLPYDEIDELANEEYIEFQDKRIWTSGIDGRTIVAKTLTADHVFVSDLSAFKAKIGGFNLDDQSIYSDGKDNIGSATAGVYLDKAGQFYFGDDSNHIKFTKDQNDVFHFEFVSQALNDQAANQAKYIRFGESAAAICIGEIPETSDEYVELRIDNNSGINFVKSTDPNNPITSWKLDEFHAGNLVIDLDKKAQFGNFAFIPRSDGSLMFVKVGD